jgi:hypothetical protein
MFIPIHWGYFYRNDIPRTAASKPEANRKRQKNKARQNDALRAIANLRILARTACEELE